MLLFSRFACSGATSALLAIPLAIPTAVAQGRVLSLPSPQAKLSHEFSQVRGLHELPDGRVLIADRIEERVWVADLATGKLAQVGRPGTGPTEYRLPTTLLWMPGDSTLLIDEGNTRIGIIAPPPALTIQRSFRIDLPGAPASNSVRAVDERGRYYTQSPFWTPRPQAMGDSVYLLRTVASGRTVDTMGVVLGITRPPNANRPRLTPGFPFVAMAPQDSWNVRRDGTIVIIRSNPYRMEWISPDGSKGEGAPIPYTPVKVTNDEKRSFTRQFLANSPTSGRGENGGMSATPSSEMTEERVREMVASNAFAEFKGPTTGRAPFFGVNGTVWVERAVPHGEAAQFDVLSPRGEPLERIQLGKDRRLVAIGRASLYVVVVDADGIEYVERYAIPRSLLRLFRL